MIEAGVVTRCEEWVAPPETASLEQRVAHKVAQELLGGLSCASPASAPRAIRATSEEAERPAPGSPRARTKAQEKGER